MNQRALGKRTSQIMQMDRCKISEWEVVLCTPHRVNIPENHYICLFDDKQQNHLNEIEIEI